MQEITAPNVSIYATRYGDNDELVNVTVEIDGNAVLNVVEVDCLNLDIFGESQTIELED